MNLVIKDSRGNVIPEKDLKKTVISNPLYYTKMENITRRILEDNPGLSAPEGSGVHPSGAKYV